MMSLQNFLKTPTTAALVVLGAVGGVLTHAPVATAAFAGLYNPANWTLTTTETDPQGNAILGDGSVNVSAAPDAITLIGGDSGTGNPGLTDYTIAVAPGGAGTWSFSWSFDSQDRGFVDEAGNFSGEDAGYLLNNTYTSLVNSLDIGTASSGAVGNIFVESGDVIGFRVRTTDNTNGAGQFTVSNFDVTPVPFEFSPALGLLILGGWALAHQVNQSKQK